jgi:hypothetical protein
MAWPTPETTNAGTRLPCPFSRVHTKSRTFALPRSGLVQQVIMQVCISPISGWYANGSSPLMKPFLSPAAFLPDAVSAVKPIRAFFPLAFCAKKAGLAYSHSTGKKLLFGAPTCTWRRAGEGELLFALIHCGPILPELVEGGNRQGLAGFLAVLPHRQDRRRAAAERMKDEG